MNTKKKKKNIATPPTQFQSIQPCFVECVPATNIPRNQQQHFTYCWQLKIPPTIGQIVTIQLGKKQYRAIIQNIHPQNTKFPYSIKPISNIFTDIPPLPQSTLTLAQTISDYYASPLSLVYKTILPTIPKRTPKPIQATTQKRETPLTLTKEQRSAVQHITTSINASTFLLQGPTGSGKTEVYLHVIQNALNQKKQAIVLVPEISLTPQAQDRYSERFGINNISIIHSNQTMSHRFLSWHRFFTRKTNILIGPRSAILTPSENLGVIIIDEEHESSYKQWDQHPRYDARVVAEERSKYHKIPLVFGSATPRLQSIIRTSPSMLPNNIPISTQQSFKKSPITLLPMTKRISGDSMPAIKTIDMRDELRNGNTSPISYLLHEAIAETLNKKKQIVLFINRRGSATFVLCRDCGYTAECPNCNIPLTYHQQHKHHTHQLLCHHCSYKIPIPTSCPVCNSTRIKYFGTGTQRIESEITRQFPKTTITRMDSDTAERRGSHKKIYKAFEKKEIDILIGTQMITKGWDIPSVDLIGIIAADTLLHLPDYKSSERAFQLLTQVAGRTGRGKDRGLVHIQTYNPDHPVINAVKSYSQQQLLNKEIVERFEFQYPPFVQCIQILIEHNNPKKAQQLAKNTHNVLLQHAPKNTQILGPSPAFIARKNKKYRWNILLKLPMNTDLNKRNALLGLLPEQALIDIDPESLL